MWLVHSSRRSNDDNVTLTRRMRRSSAHRRASYQAHEAYSSGLKNSSSYNAYHWAASVFPFLTCNAPEISSISYRVYHIEYIMPTHPEGRRGALYVNIIYQVLIFSLFFGLKFGRVLFFRHFGLLGRQFSIERKKTNATIC